MAITFTAGTSVESTASVTSTTVTLPSGLAAGDYTIIVVSLNVSSGGITTPSGWTDILPSTASVNGSTSDKLAIFYRKWVSGDSNPVITTSNGRVAATPIKVSGADGTTFVNTAATVTQAAAGATTVTAPTITPSSVQLCCTFNGRNATNGNFITPWSSLSAGMTMVAEASGKATNATNAGHCFAVETVTSGAATGTRQADPAVAVTGGMGVSFALNVGTSDITATPTGIASAEAFGTPADVSTLTSAPTGIGSGQTFGAVVAALTLLVAPGGIASSEALGSPTATTGGLSAQPTGIPSAETFGTPTRLSTLSAQPTGIGSAEAFGTPTRAATLTAAPTGIGSAEAFGTPTELATLNASPAGIGSAESSGSPTATATLTSVPAGIPTSEAFGTPSASGNSVQPTGIPSAETFGQPTALVAINAAPTGIPTAQAFGTPTATVQASVQPTGIPSAETFGTPTELSNLNAVPTGIPSGEVVGSPVLVLTLTVQPGGIGSAESFGTPTRVATLTVQPVGIGSGESFGNPANLGAILAQPVGIASAQAFGTPTELGNLNAVPTGIASAQAFGTPTAERMFRFYPAGIASAEAFGIPRSFIGAENLNDYVLELEPAVIRWVFAEDSARYELMEQENRISFAAADLWELVEEPRRWVLTGIEGEPMIIEIYSSAGAQEYVGGTITEKKDKDISAIPITMTLGSEKFPGSSWAAPDQDESGPLSVRHVLMMVGASENTPPGTYYAWAKIGDGSEAIVRRFPQTVIVK